jgi:hypothetical protein
MATEESLINSEQLSQTSKINCPMCPECLSRHVCVSEPLSSNGYKLQLGVLPMFSRYSSDKIEWQHELHEADKTYLYGKNIIRSREQIEYVPKGNGIWQQRDNSAIYLRLVKM